MEKAANGWPNWEICDAGETPETAPSRVSRGVGRMWSVQLAGKFQPYEADVTRIIEDAFQRQTQTLERLLKKDKTDLEKGNILAFSEAEAQAGKLIGPWEVWLDETGHPRWTVPYDRWLPTLRFPREQERPDTSYEVRPIDDCSGSGLNAAVQAVEKMRMDGIRALTTTAHYIMHCDV